MTSERFSTKKIVFIVLGIMLILSFFNNSELITGLSDWSTANQVGQNVGGLIFLFLGVYLMILGIRKK